MKIKSTKYFCLYIVCLIISNGITAQNFNLNIANEKYWYYRNRLMYFVKPGLNQGESNVARDRNNVLQTTTIN